MSYSRSPRALRSMTVGIRGTRRTLPLAVLRRRSLGQPLEHGRPREAPAFADSPARKLAAARQLLDEWRLDLEQLGNVLERQDVGLERAERVAADDRGGLLVGLDRHAPIRRVADVARQQLRDDGLLRPARLEGEAIQRAGLGLRYADEQRGRG